MVDRGKAWMRLRHKQVRSQLSDWQISRIEATMARKYTDDSDIFSGALSIPRQKERPGQRDDALGYALNGLTHIL